MSTSIFAGLGAAEVHAAGQYITPGNYVFRIKQILIKESSRNRGQMMAIHELEVVEFAATASTYESSKGGEIVTEDCPVWERGQALTWLVQFKHASALANIKQILIAVLPDLEKLPEAEWSAEADKLYGPDNPLCGLQVRCEAFGTRTREKNLPFTVCRWSPTH